MESLQRSKAAPGGADRLASRDLTRGRKIRGARAEIPLALADESLLLLALFRAPVAQLDRASDYGSEGLGFDSLRVRQSFIPKRDFVENRFEAQAKEIINRAVLPTSGYV
jgi:hypothetical protein